MSERAAIREYFMPPPITFWRWDREGLVVEWANGGTLAFRQELTVILERLAPTGLPPFELILLLWGGCRLRQFPSEERRRLIINPEGLQGKGRVYWAWIIETLERVEELPRELTTTTAGMVTTIQATLEQHPLRLRLADSQLVLRDWQEFSPSSPAVVENREKSQAAWIHELRGMYDALLRLEPEALLLRLKTGLPFIPEPAAELAIVPEEAPLVPLRVLLEELQEDEQLGGLARVARQLWGAMQLPKSLFESEDLPLGGVSDVSNRGPLHRLLISELAQDDEVLMTRVALREALYLSREATRSNPLRRRCLLIDVGLRMWGVPRLLAISAGLALLMLPDQPGEIWTARQDDFAATDLHSRDGLIELLARLTTSLHPGNLLEKYRETLQPTDDVVLIVGEDVHADPDWQRAVARHLLPPLYVVTVNRCGNLTLLLQTPRGERVLKQVRVDLAALEPRSSEPAEQSAHPRRRESLIDETLNIDYPAFMRLSRPPLRFSAGIDNNKSHRIAPVPLPDGRPTAVLTVTSDRRLLWWDDSLRGGQELTAELPAGGILAMDRRQNCLRIYVGLANSLFGMLVTVDLETRESVCRQVQVPRLPFCTATFHAGNLLIVRERHVAIISGETGELLTEFFTGQRYWTSGRFFVDPLTNYRDGSLSFRILAVSGDAQGEHFELVTETSTAPLRVLELPYGAGPVLMDLNYKFWSPPSKPLSIGILPILPQYAQETEVFPGVLTERTDNSELLVLQAMGSHQQAPSSRVLISGQELAEEFLRLQRTGDRKTESLRLRPVDLDQQFVQLQPGTEREQLHQTRYQILHQSRIGPLLPKLAAQRVQQRTVRSQIRLIGVAEGRLVLTHPRGQKLILKLSNDSQRLILFPVPLPASLSRTFGPSFRPKGRQYRLRQVDWEDGSRATLDSRGLLHLRSSRQNLPEITLVLQDMEVTCWTSAGTCCGDDYFLQPDSRKVPAQVIMEQVLTPFVKQLR